MEAKRPGSSNKFYGHWCHNRPSGNLTHSERRKGKIFRILNNCSFRFDIAVLCRDAWRTTKLDISTNKFPPTELWIFSVLRSNYSIAKMCRWCHLYLKLNDRVGFFMTLRLIYLWKLQKVKFYLTSVYLRKSTC